MAQKESTTTVVVAIAANLGIAIAKGVAGALSGSAAMLSEAAHSLADTSNADGGAWSWRSPRRGARRSAGRRTCR
jgi:divalent metal cation (Fe/Co/Zn/Cd) transporter